METKNKEMDEAKIIGIRFDEAYDAATAAGEITKGLPAEEVKKITITWMKKNLEERKAARAEEARKAAAAERAAQAKKVPPPAPKPKDPFEGLTGEALYEAEWKNDPGLHGEFAGDFAIYSAFRTGVDSNQIIIRKRGKLKTTKTKAAGTLDPDELKKAFVKDENLQRIYGSVEAYIAFKQAEAAGRVRRLKKK